MSEKIKILLVEDDPNLSLVLQDYLEMLGYETKLCRDGEEGLKAFKRHRFDLCVFDVMMPKKDGFSLAEDIRRANQSVPIIFLTAKALKEDRIKGFQVGCDDYITKPFSTEELSLRIKAILKRLVKLFRKPAMKLQMFSKSGFFHSIQKNMMLTAEGFEQNLTRKEAGLLKLLCQHKNNLLSREYALKNDLGRK